MRKLIRLTVLALFVAGVGCRSSRTASTVSATPATSIAASIPTTQPGEDGRRFWELSRQEQVKFIYGGDAAIQTLQKAASVEIQILDETPGRFRLTEPGKILSTKKISDPQLIGRFSDLLIRDDSYDFGEYLTTGEPALGFRFVGGDGREVQLFYEPNTDLIGTQGADQDDYSNTLVLSRGRAAFLELLRATWPDRPELAAIPLKSTRVSRDYPPAILDAVAHPDEVWCRLLEDEKTVRTRNRWASNPIFYCLYFSRHLLRLPRSDLQRGPVQQFPVDRALTIEGRSERRVDVQTAREWSSILLDSDTYRRQVAIAGCFEPGFAVKFKKGAVVVNYSICLACQHHAVGVEGVDQKTSDEFRPLSLYSLTGLGRLGAMAKKVFPEDPRMQRLE